MSGITAKTELRENPHSLNEEKEILACHQFEAFKESLLATTVSLKFYFFIHRLPPLTVLRVFTINREKFNSNKTRKLIS